LALLQNRDPRQASLRAFQQQKLKQAALVMARHAPFIVMVSGVKGIIAAPGAAVQNIWLIRWQMLCLRVSMAKKFALQSVGYRY
jgi:hypothetical protein